MLLGKIIIDGYELMLIKISNCRYCKNIMSINSDNRRLFVKCKAFDAIPDEILSGYFDHRNPYPNAENPTDNGIRFEPISEVQ